MSVISKCVALHALCFAISFTGFSQKDTLLFRHHFIDTTLPVKPDGNNIFGDYGLTALTDIDHDGKPDFILGGRQPAPSRLYWYQYVQGDQWVRHEVGTDYKSDVGLAAMDVDGDGWTDLVCSGVWYRNTGKPRTEPFERIVFDDTASGAHDVVACDVNKDGKTDIIVMGDEHTALHGMYWYSIPANPRQPWTKHFIAPPEIHGAIAPAGIGDINGDGLPDIVRADTWFENTKESQEWIAHKNIPMGRKGPFGYCVRAAVADMDNTGKSVIVMCDADIEDSKICILCSPDGKGKQWIKQSLPQSFTYGSLHSLAIADLNGDGRLDIVSNEQEELLPNGRQNPRWIAWLNLGKGRYKEIILLDAKLGGHELQVADVDGDGDMDICSKAWGPMPWNALGGKMHVDYLENVTNKK